MHFIINIHTIINVQTLQEPSGCILPSNISNYEIDIVCVCVCVYIYRWNAILYMYIHVSMYMYANDIQYTVCDVQYTCTSLLSIVRSLTQERKRSLPRPSCRPLSRLQNVYIV